MTFALYFLYIILYLLISDQIVSKPLRASFVFISSYASMIATGIALLFSNEIGIPSQYLLSLLMFALAGGIVFRSRLRSFSVFDSLRSACGFLANMLYIPQVHGLFSRFVRFTNQFTSIYLIILLFVSALGSVTNGDAQTYNLPRIASAYLVKKTFLLSTSIPTQAFHSFGHDYVFAPDIVVGNLVSLSLIGVIETVFLLLMSDQYLRRSIQFLAVSETAKVGIRSFNRLLILSFPAVFFQGNNVKNDLVIAPIVFCMAMSAEALFSNLLLPTHRHKNGQLNLSSHWNSLHLSLLILCAILLYVTKAYGIIFGFLAIALLFISTLLLKRKTCHLTPGLKFSPLSHSKRIDRSFAALLALSWLLSGVLALAIGFFERIKMSIWINQYSQFVSHHGPEGLTSLLVFPVTFFRVLVELALNIPSPFKISFDHSTPLLGGSSFTVGGPYEFGGVLNQDIAWPGLLFNIAFVSVVFALLFRGKLALVRSIYSSLPESVLLRSLAPYTLSISAGIGACLLVWKIYWQPMFSRYLLTPSLLVLPSLSILAYLVFCLRNTQAKRVKHY